MTHEKSLLMFPKCRAVTDMKAVALEWRISRHGRIRILGAAKIMKSFSHESMFSSAKFLMTLEEFHFQATKMPNRGFVDDRYLWVMTA
jgi:hypothetical protein